MLTADEARKIASDESKKISKQFEEIEKYISESAFSGEYSIYVMGELHPCVHRYLERIGYKVETNKTEHNEPFYSVYWLE